jgi:hypothetical protein
MVNIGIASSFSGNFNRTISSILSGPVDSCQKAVAYRTSVWAMPIKKQRAPSAHNDAEEAPLPPNSFITNNTNPLSGMSK